MTEFLKGYAAGANDMEAGRLVARPKGESGVLPLGQQLEATRGAWLEARAEVESLREQLAVHERWIESYGHPEEWVKSAQAAHGRAEAAEAKLAEVEKELEELRKGDA